MTPAVQGLRAMSVSSRVFLGIMLTFYILLLISFYNLLACVVRRKIGLPGYDGSLLLEGIQHLRP